MGSVFDLDDLLGEAVDSFLHLGDEVLGYFEDEEGGLHVLPGDVEVLVLDGHPLMEGDHVGALVVVGASEQKGQELDHRRVQLWNVADIFQEEVVDALVRQHKLVELSNHFLQLIVAAYPLEDRRHIFQLIIAKICTQPLKHPICACYLPIKSQRCLSVQLRKYRPATAIILFFYYNMDERDNYRLHFNDVVSDSEVQLTTRLTHVLTENNIRRVEKQSQKFKPPQAKGKPTKEDYLYVCITGLPALVDEFDGLQLPGEKIVVYPECFTPGITEEQARERLQYAHIELQAHSLHLRLKNHRDKPLVFVFHSFGTTIVSAFLRLHYSEYLPRVKGMIPIGAYTVRPDRHFKQYIEFAESMTKEYMLENADHLFEMHKQLFETIGLTTNHGSKYGNLASLYAFGKGMGFREMFSFIRQWPPVLKCFIYGREDNRLAEDNLNETAIYYCHKRKFNEDYETRARQVMKARYNLPVDNIQERFVYNLEKGKHSVHVQKRHKSLVIKIIKEYLEVLEQI